MELQGKMIRSIDIEEWRNMKSSSGYQISNQGRARSIDRDITLKDGSIRHYKGRILKQNTGTSGYKYVICSVHGVSKTIYIHQEVAKVFIGDASGLTVDHINEVKTDNRLSNLRYLTHFENSSRSNHFKHYDNTFENNPRAKIVVGYKDGKVYESFNCAKLLTIKYGINYSTLRAGLQKGKIVINGIEYRYGVKIN